MEFEGDFLLANLIESSNNLDRQRWLALLREYTDQDFCLDVEAWQQWLIDHPLGKFEHEIAAEARKEIEALYGVVIPRESS